MADEERIARFKALADEDPGNDLAHFSLGKAYLDEERFKEAIPSLMQVLRINPGFSKAYVMLALAQKGVGDPDGAVNTLTKGYKVAQERGDLMPRNEMGALLKELGAAIPEEAKVELTPEMAAAGQILCKRCGRVGRKMKEKPFSGPVGENIHATICEPCFRLWIGQGTKVINELRLNLTEKSGQEVYDQHMKEFLNLV